MHTVLPFSVLTLLSLLQCEGVGACSHFLADIDCTISLGIIHENVLLHWPSIHFYSLHFLYEYYQNENSFKKSTSFLNTSAFSLVFSWHFCELQQTMEKRRQQQQKADYYCHVLVWQHLIQANIFHHDFQINFHKLGLWHEIVCSHLLRICRQLMQVLGKRGTTKESNQTKSLCMLKIYLQRQEATAGNYIYTGLAFTRYIIVTTRFGMKVFIKIFPMSCRLAQYPLILFKVCMENEMNTWEMYLYALCMHNVVNAKRRLKIFSFSLSISVYSFFSFDVDKTVLACQLTCIAIHDTMLVRETGKNVVVARVGLIYVSTFMAILR